MLARGLACVSQQALLMQACAAELPFPPWQYQWHGVVAAHMRMHACFLPYQSEHTRSPPKEVKLDWDDPS